MPDSAAPISTTTRWQGLPGNIQGAAWLVLGSVTFAMQAVAVKSLGQRLDVVQIGFFRCLFGLIAVVPFLYGTNSYFLRGKAWLHVVRAFVGVAGMLCSYYAVTHLPLATATAISFTKPLFLIILAVLFLGETVHWPRWTATVVGFIGVLIVARPGSEIFDPAMLVALAGSFFIADVAILVKKLSQNDRNATIMFYFGSITTVVAAIPAYFVWQMPVDTEWLLLAFVGVSAATAQYCTLRALRVGEASAVMPFDYTRLLFAGLFGYAFFAETPDGWTLVGIAVLVASTLYLAHREYQLGRTPSLGGG
jgi:drug/metabolite transporter (DMT)-like permease